MYKVFLLLKQHIEKDINIDDIHIFDNKEDLLKFMDVHYEQFKFKDQFSNKYYKTPDEAEQLDAHDWLEVHEKEIEK